MSPTATHVALAATPLLDGADPADVDRLAGVTTTRRFDPGEALFRRGGQADDFHVVLEGRVALRLHVSGRGDLTVETKGRGDVVGVSWAVAPYRWELDAVAVDEVRTLQIDGAAVRAMLGGDDPLGVVVLRGVTRLLGERLHACRLRLMDIYEGDRRR